MLTFDHRDFTKSALSLAGGMLGVAFLAAWRSQFDIPTMSLTLGLPLGVVAFWGIYSLRMKRMADDLGFVRHRPRSNSGQGAPGNFQPKLLHQGHHSQLTLEAAQHLPRFRARPKLQPQAWDGQDTPPIRDQWHQ